MPRWLSSLEASWHRWAERRDEKRLDRVQHPFWTIVHKEIADHVHSWRFIILIALISLTCLGSLYSALMAIREVGTSDEVDKSFFVLKLFTISGNSLPSFLTFVSFLGPLLGIGMGFDAVNSERNKGTLSRVMSQPIHRDYLLNAKFVAALILISVMFVALSLLVLGMSLYMLGIPPTPEEVLRILAFDVLVVFYIGFWLNLSIAFSVRFKQPATSALAAIAVWLFFAVFFSMLIELILNAVRPPQTASTEQIIGFLQFSDFINRLSPSHLFNEATITLLVPTTNNLSSFLTPEQVYGSLPGTPLSLGQSLLLVWPQMTGLFAATMICFAISYVMFMRQEIRSRN
jgi:ABC-type transport system involved in multi-copper enzyme maturation, permease component